MAALFPTNKDAQRLSKYPHYKGHLKIDEMTFPMTLDQIDKFSRMNPILSITIFAYKLKKKNLDVFPVYANKNQNGTKIHLLMIENGETNHFCWIKNLGRLVMRQIGTGNHKHHICDRCLNYFTTSLKLQHHLIDCGTHNEVVKIQMPEPNEYIEFKKFSRSEPVQYVIYADFEAMLIPLVNNDDDDDDEPQTAKIQRHETYSVGFYLHCMNDTSKSFYRAYPGEDCIEWFLLQLRQIAEVVEHAVVHPMTPLTADQKMEFIRAEKCHICKVNFKSGDKRVHDPCHVTGRYRGPAHQHCNLNNQDSCVIPIVMHNLSGYDGHFLIKPLLQVYEGSVQIIPTNKEKYISFTKTVGNIQLRFIDPFRFLPSSPDDLASDLQADKKCILRNQIPDPEQFILLSRKGVFPYDHVKSWESLQETQLPCKDFFYNKLTDTSISDENYAHAQNVY